MAPISAPTAGLYMVATGTQQVIAYDADLKPTVLAEGIAGNDLVVRHDGGVYVTNPGGTGPAQRQSGLVHQSERREEGRRLPASGYPNGVTLSPDQSLLYVADMRSHWVYSYAIQPDGSLANKQKYLPPPHARHRRRRRRRRHPGRRLRPALCRHSDGRPGLRPAGPGQRDHPDPQRQVVQPRASAARSSTPFTSPPATRSSSAS